MPSSSSVSCCGHWPSRPIGTSRTDACLRAPGSGAAHMPDDVLPWHRVIDDEDPTTKHPAGGQPDSIGRGHGHEQSSTPGAAARRRSSLTRSTGAGLRQDAPRGLAGRREQARSAHKVCGLGGNLDCQAVPIVVSPRPSQKGARTASWALDTSVRKSVPLAYRCGWGSIVETVGPIVVTERRCRGCPWPAVIVSSTITRRGPRVFRRGG